MKTLKLISLIGITSIALAQIGWAGRGGGGGGGGGGGFGGGGHFGGGGGARFGGGGGAHFGGGFSSSGFRPAFSAPSRAVGVGTRGGGVGFGMGRQTPYQSSPSSSVRSSLAGRSGNSSVRSTASKRPSAPVLSQSRSATAANRSANSAPPTRQSGAVAQRGLNGRTDHIYARHDQNWHGDWDRHHAHYSRNHWWVYDSGAWIGLDDGFYPWDYYPYYAFDYYPYDYYPGYYSDVEPYYNNEGVYDSVPAADPNVTAVQNDLTKLGYYHGPVDGLYGRPTRDAVARYQNDHHLAITGTLTTQPLQSLGVSPSVAS